MHQLIKAVNDDSDAAHARATFEQMLADESFTINRAFKRFIQAIQDDIPDELIKKIIEEKDLKAFLNFISDYVDEFADELPNSFVRAAQSEVERLSQPGVFGIGKLDMEFDPGAQSAAEIIRDSKLKFIKDFTANQRDAVRTAIADSLDAGEGPAASARAFRDAIGLTESQVKAVNNYQRLLENGSSQALDRQLRDARFDRTVARIIEDDDLLSGKQIERMVGRYAENMRNHRAMTIARTETMRALNQAKQEAWAQIADELNLDPDEDVERMWVATLDDRVRETHHDMHRQTVVGMDTPFESPSGEELLYPGDPAASPEETINCRCTLVVKFIPPIKKAGFDPDEPRDDHGRWVDMLHGSPRQFDSFKGKYAFFTSSENVAEQYSRGGILGAGNTPTGEHTPTVYRVKVDPGNTFDLRNPDHRAIYNDIRSKHNAAVTDPDERLPSLKSEGFIQRSGLPGFGHATAILEHAFGHGFSSMAVDEGSQGHSLLVRNPSERTKIVKAGFDPDEPRDDHGRWTDDWEGDPEDEKKKKTQEDLDKLISFGQGHSAIGTPELAEELTNRDVTADEFVSGLFPKVYGESPTGYIRGDKRFGFKGFLAAEDGSKLGVVERTIDFKHNEVNHDFFSLGKTGTGKAKEILNSQVKLYQKLGLNEVKTNANIEVGGYAWAKYGFLPDKMGWKSLQKEVRTNLDALHLDPLTHQGLDQLTKSSNPKALWAISDSKYGKQLLMGTDWYGSLKLHDTDSMNRFNSYIGKR